MSKAGSYQSALDRLRGILAKVLPGTELHDEIIATKAQVLARYQPLFTLANLDAFDAEEFRTFLYFENNHHWSGLYRKGITACLDVDALRAGLRLLLDESQPIETRYTRAIEMVPGMGRALATAILTVAFPDAYGVWNNTSEAALRRFGVWPEFERASSLGQRYVAVNTVLLRLAQDLGTDLWTLDALWWAAAGDDEGAGGRDESGANEGGEPAREPLQGPAKRFVLEKHLEEFLVGNWTSTELGRDWKIFASDGDDEAGNQFPTDVGSIDILARHRREPRWLVIELKRGKSSDETVGQILRYMGWVKQHLAAADDRVEGLIIAHERDAKVDYALISLPSVSILLYEVQFRLHQCQRASTGSLGARSQPGD